MDLATESERLRLDLLMVRVSRALSAAGVPHVILKGPTTANWLYDPPRAYRDVDVLVPLSAVDDVVRALAKVATPRAGGVGEEAQHSLLLHSHDGYEVDVHVSLPTMPPMDDGIWNVMATQLETMHLDVGDVPVLTVPARCFVLCLHALNSGVEAEKSMEDLRRARAAVDGEIWEQARAIARTLDAEDLMDAGLHLVEPSGTAVASVRSHLFATRAPSAALALQRLAEAPLRALPKMAGREILPTRGFMAHANADLVGSHFWLFRAHLRRWRRLVSELPAGLRAWVAARRSH